MTTSSNSHNSTPGQRVLRIGSAAAITIVGGTVFVGGQPISAASFTVSNLNAAGAGSLSQAVDDANAAAGADTITFNAGLAGELDIGPNTLRIKDDLTITGPGSAIITLTNQDDDDVLYLYNGANLTISGLTIDDAARHAIRSVSGGDLVLNDMRLTDASNIGIYTTMAGDLTIADSTISRSAGPGIYFYKSGDVTLTDTTLSSNARDGALFKKFGSLSATRVTGFGNADSSLDIYQPSGDVSVVESEFRFDGSASIDVYAAAVAGVENVDVSITDTTAQSVERLLTIDKVDGDVVLDNIDVTTTFDVGIGISEVEGDVTIRDVDVTNSWDDAINISTIGGLAAPSEVLIERVNVAFASQAGVDIDSVYGNVTARDITVSQAMNADPLDISDIKDAGGGEGNIVVERLIASDSDGGLDASGEGDITATDITVSVSRDDAIDLDAGGDVVVDRITSDRIYSGSVQLNSSTASVTLTNASMNLHDEALDIYAGTDINISDITLTNVLDDDAIELYAKAGAITAERIVVERAEDNGIVVEQAGTDATLTNISVSESGADGLYVNEVPGLVTLSEITVDMAGNTGIDVYNVGDLTISDVRITDVDGRGAEIYIAGTVDITDVDITDPGEHGLYVQSAGASKITGLTISGANDSGLQLYNTAPTMLVNSTIADNATSSASGGAGIELYNSDIAIFASTITDNSGPHTGAAVFRRGTSSATVTASIVVDNDGLAAFGDDAGPGTLVVKNTLVDTGTGLAGSTIETSDAQLGNLQDNGGPTRTIKPAPGSPAIDAVVVPFPPGALDQRGVLRPVGPAADLGSVEVNAGSVGFDPAAVTVDEAAGTVDLTLVRTGGLDGDATVDLVTASGTATAGVDFTAVSETVTLPDNAASVTVTVPIIDDGDDEPDETFTATISNPSVVAVGSASTATVTITDDDVVAVVTDVITPLAPARFADTRPNGETFDDIAEKTGKLAAGDEITVQIAGRGGVPSDAVGVVMNVTAIQGETAGFITAHPCLDPRPNTSALNYSAGVPLGNEVIASLDATGKVCLYSSSAANLTVDVVGFIPAGSPLTPVTPARLVDTRPTGATVDDLEEGDGKTTAGENHTFRIAGRAGVPADAAAAILNVTAIGATSGGYITVHPCVDPIPTASSLNHVAGVNRGNELVASLDASGDVCIFTSASVHLAVDIVAYVPAGTSLSSVTPARLFDSRPGQDTVDGQAARTTKFDANEEVTLPVAGRAGVPAAAKAVIVNITAVAPEGTGFITVHPCVDPRPLASSLNYVAGVNGGNEIIASLDANGDLCLFSSATTHLTVDIVGYLV